VLVKARLKGQEFDLLTVTELFCEGEPGVGDDDEGYYLSFSVPRSSFATVEDCTTPRRCYCVGSTAWPGRSAATLGRWV
jgi:hypothetical protein